MSLKGTETEKNLLKAFAGESQARNRYTMFAKIAKKEGYEQIADLFLETAANELEHAKIFFRHLEGGMVEITAAYPAGVEGTTKENLLAAAEGEMEEALSCAQQVYAGLMSDHQEPTDLIVFLRCYNVFKANNDDRARELLEIARSKILKMAETIEDDDLKQMFLNNEYAHREILKEYDRVAAVNL